MPSNVKLLAGASGGEPTDANFKNVTLLLHGDGSNGAQNNTFIDSSTNNFTITRNGNTTQGSFSPYGSNWSNYFDGSGDYINAGSNSAFAFGTGAYTVEAWVYITGSNSLNNLFCNDSTNGFDLYFNYSSNTTLLEFRGGSNVITFSAIPTRNTWTHVALVREGTGSNQTKLYFNGVLQGSGTDATNWTVTGPMLIGAIAVGADLHGYISNARIVKGTAVYTSAFTPPTQPLTAITNTSLLTCAYNRFRDGSTNNFTITRNGDVKVTNFAPFAPSSAYSTTTNGGSAFFDGSGDYLTVSNQTAFSFGTGDFTLETWIYFDAVQGFIGIIDTRASSVSGDQPWVFGLRNSSGMKLELFLSDAARYAGSITINPRCWNHLVISRVSGTLRSFVNGVVDYNASMTSNVNANGTTQYIGREFISPTDFTGYLSDVRVVKGSGVTSVTVPTTPLTAITNTQLLVKAQNAAIFDNSMKNDLETVGNAQISTSVKKFGTGSMAFVNAAGDRVFAPSSTELALGSGNFTLECWVYPTAFTTNYAALFDFRSGPNFQATAPLIYLDTGGKVWWNDTISSSGTLSLNTWSHVAFVRNSGTITIYINGTSAGSASNTNTFVCNLFNIGATNDLPTTYYLRGYMDDIRLTKGVARYTANFTAPTAPFPNK